MVVVLVVVLTVVDPERDQSNGGPLSAGELAAELGDVLSYSASRQDSEQ